MNRLAWRAATVPGPLASAGSWQAGEEAGAAVSPAIAWAVLRIFGPRGVRGFLRNDRARARVHIPAPTAEYRALTGIAGRVLMVKRLE